MNERPPINFGPVPALGKSSEGGGAGIAAPLAWAGTGTVPPERPVDLRIARDGTWYHEGAPIRRPELVRLFASVLRRDEAGTYWLVTPVERTRIVVEDVPFLAVEWAVREEEGGPVLSFRTNVGRWVEAGPEHPIRLASDPESGETKPYIGLGNGLEARIARPVYYDLVERAIAGAEVGEAEIGVWSRGTYFTLGSVDGL